MNKMDNKERSNSYSLITNFTSDDIAKCKKRTETEKASEKNRRKIPSEGFKYPIEDYINLTIKGYNKQTLKAKTYCNYNKEKTPSAVVFLVHGLVSHANKAAHVAQSLSEAGYFACAMDLREHGLTEEDLTYIKDFNDFIEDMSKFVTLTKEFIKDTFKKDLPMFIMGSSMGGLIIYYVSKKISFKGVIYCSPCFEIPLNWFIKQVLSTIAWFTPWKILPKDDEPTLSKNPAIEEDNDPIIAKRQPTFGSVRTLVSQCNGFMYNLSLKNESHENALVMIFGGIEKIVTIDSIVSYYNSSKVKDKTSWFYPNSWHGVLVEEEVYDIMPRLNKWIGDRIK